jgi:hypothetical protein
MIQLGTAEIAPTLATLILEGIKHMVGTSAD